MKYAQPKLRQMLAAEYVLGTLRGAARRRFERLQRSDAGLRAEVNFWEQRLAGLALRITPQTPRAVVWAEIDRQINLNKVTALPAATVQRVNFWRAWAIAASVACVGLSYQVWQLLQQGPQIVEVPKIITVKVPQPMPYVAVLMPGGEIRYTMALSPENGLIKVVATGGKPPVDYASRCLELWVLDEAGTPHSLGILPEGGEAQIKMPANVAMPKSPTLAISDEPAGGSKTGLPTGPVLTAGPAIKAI